ncbi:50S ribosomal protein L10 [Poriferisphaera corsica]|uniref:Large ribosomal subunit protein uL10 n=1 Tax=Poriferisphaera corsica TaxID=2528020 RepID=A0A517YUI9_9BACT|nr:50S ribosomal protein L10 [Poriferisphaera corsica]QDU33884.1 50S ribosomal protein L10 [Poriferisphaera corsica]
MSKPVKNLIKESYKKRFDGLTGAVVVDIRGIESNDNNRMRSGLREKQMRVSVVKNTLAKAVFEGTDMSLADEVIDGPSALVFPTDESVSVVNVARELITWSKELEAFEFKGAVMEGIVFGADEIDKLSKYPTREEAHAKAVQLILSPAQTLVGAIKSPASNIASILKTIEEKLEKGEEIAKVG